MKVVSILSLAVITFFSIKESCIDYCYFLGKIFSRQDSYITYPEAKEFISEIIPPEAIVGGDSPYSTLREGITLYYIDRWLWEPGFPDYFIKSPDTTITAIEKRHGEFYDVIVTPDSLENIFGKSGGWDFYLLRKRWTVNGER